MDRRSFLLQASAPNPAPFIEVQQLHPPSANFRADSSSLATDSFEHDSV
jgi:hypothetical protein